MHKATNLLLLQILEQGQRERTVAFVLQLDFSTAFTSMSMNAIYRTLEAYGVPEVDIASLQRMQSGAWYSVATCGKTAACEGRDEASKDVPLVRETS